MSSDSGQVCFVISPIGADDSPERKKADQLLRYIVKPALEARGYVVKRADDIHDPGTISKQIIELLISAPMVVADMTGHNPNVFYELAVRHAAKLPVVHMIEKGQTIPFDVAPQRAIFYELALDGAEEAKKSLGAMLQAISESNEEPDSPLSNALDRIALGNTGEAGQREAALLEIVQDIHLRMVNLDSRFAADAPEHLHASESQDVLDYYSYMIDVFRQLLSDEEQMRRNAPVVAKAMETLFELVSRLRQGEVVTGKDFSKLRHPSRAHQAGRLVELLEAQLGPEPVRSLTNSSFTQVSG